MKKTLSLLLLVSLISFTVGCRLFDIGSDSPQETATTFNMSVKVPAAAVPGAPSIRASVPSPQKVDWSITINGVTFDIKEIEEDENEPGFYIVIGEKDLYSDDWRKVTEPSAPIVIRAQRGNHITLSTTFFLDKALAPGHRIILEFDDDDGEIKPTKVVNSENEEIEVTITTTESGQEITPAFSLKQITYEDETLLVDAENPIIVSRLDPEFVFEFNRNVELASWTVVVMVDDEKWELTDEGQPASFTFEIDEQDSSKAILSFATIPGDVSPYYLKYQQTIGIYIDSATTKDGRNYTPRQPRYFRTAPTITMPPAPIFNPKNPSKISISNDYEFEISPIFPSAKDFPEYSDIGFMISITAPTGVVMEDALNNASFTFSNLEAFELTARVDKRNFSIATENYDFPEGVSFFDGNKLTFFAISRHLNDKPAPTKLQDSFYGFLDTDRRVVLSGLQFCHEATSLHDEWNIEVNLVAFEYSDSKIRIFDNEIIATGNGTFNVVAPLD